MNRFLLSALVIAQVLATCMTLAHASTKEEVKERGHLLCGVSTGIPGFSNPDAKGGWSGLDVDICRAVAAALLDDASKVKYVSLGARERATALFSGEVDLLARNTTWTMTRDTALGLHFTAPSFYDRQGLLVLSKSGISDGKELDGRTVCSLTGSVAGPKVEEEFNRRKWDIKSLSFDTSDTLTKAFSTGRCDAITGPVAQLLGIRQKLPSPGLALLLPDYFGKIAMGPAVRQGDAPWFSLVRWVLFAMINGDELQISSQNVDALKDASDPRIQRFLGAVDGLGKGLGLSHDWAFRIIKQVGNYSESFERNLGQGSSIKMKRGLNELWSRGGLLFAPEMR
jgi:general L-amino acid transport system substrate-binding protein